MGKRIILLFIILFSLFNCTNKNNANKECYNSEIMSVHFSRQFNFSKLDTLIIDNQKYTHTYSKDSINSGNFLPKEKVVFFEKEGKEMSTKTNTITIARIFASKLKKNGKYKIINIPELLTTGIIKFERIDKEAIKICTTKNYPATIKGL